jgi:hypothetical protein
MDNISNKIIDFYKDKKSHIKKQLPHELTAVANSNSGIGDCLSVSHLPKVASEQNKKVYIYSPSPHFETFKKFNPFYEYKDTNFARAEFIQGYYSAGNGHFFQRLQRACGLIPDLKPQATIITDSNTIKNKIILHFNVGIHAEVQKRTVHPRAREFYPEHKESMQKWILDNQNNYQFIEVGTEFSELQGVENRVGLSLENTILEMATGEYYIGLHSGIMHIAAALNLKSIVIINFPKANELYLPALKDVDIPDLSWLYPQNIHLHEDDEGDLVPKFSYDNINRAINGEIYPFFSTKFLDLINYEIK